MAGTEIRTAALAYVRERRLLQARSADKTAFYMAGGKIDAGESALEALHREIREELGAGIVAAGALVIGTGGTTAPLVIGGGAALWTTGRAASDLHDKATHGQDITDLSDPSVRSNWLEVAAGALSVGAVGGAVLMVVMAAACWLVFRSGWRLKS